MISTHTASWEVVGWEWDLPRLRALNELTGNMPPLQIMVGRYMGYKPPEPDTSHMTTEQHAARLLGQLGMNVG